MGRFCFYADKIIDIYVVLLNESIFRFDFALLLSIIIRFDFALLLSIIIRFDFALFSHLKYSH